MTETTTTESKSASYEVALVKRLLGLPQDKRGRVFAALRTGLGKKPGTAPRMLPIIAPFLSASEGPSVTAAFLTAALLASHPVHAEVGSLGKSLRRSIEQKHGEAGVEARFAAALDADPEDFPYHLQGLVSLCESAGIPINWNRFYWDVQNLLGDDEEKQIKTRMNWARDFWRTRKDNPEAPTEAQIS